MTRLSDRLLVQALDLDGIVIIDDSSGEEVVIPAELLDALIESVQYFRDAFAEAAGRMHPSAEQSAAIARSVERLRGGPA